MQGPLGYGTLDNALCLTEGNLSLLNSAVLQSHQELLDGILDPGLHCLVAHPALEALTQGLCC